MFVEWPTCTFGSSLSRFYPVGFSGSEPKAAFLSVSGGEPPDWGCPEGSSPACRVKGALQPGVWKTVALPRNQEQHGCDQ